MITDEDFGYMCVIAIALILVGSYQVLYIDTSNKCDACFNKWNTEHNEHVWAAVSNEPIYNGEFSLCQNACTTPLERMLEVP